MKLLREYINTVIVEAKFDMETTEISRAIVDQFKSNLESMGERDFTFSVSVPSAPIGQVEMSVSFDEYTTTYRLAGEYDDGIMRVQLDLPTSKNGSGVKTISSWLGELKGTIRHELEHALQDTRGELDDWRGYDFENVDDFIDYYYDPVEVEAFAVEIYKRAKTEKMPVTGFIDERVDKFTEEAEDFVYLGEMNKSDLRRHRLNIRDNIMKTIKGRFPSAIFESITRKHIMGLLIEQEVKFSGILKLMPSPEIVSSVSSLLQQLPPEAVPLPEDKFHVTLAHQSVLKPYRKQLKQLSKDGMLLPPPPAILDVNVEERVDEELGRKSWVVWVRNQADLKAYVQDVIQLVGGPPGDPEPFRRFHISIANLTGNPGDSVR